jgi:amidophosphoribosyltransferase
VTRSEAGFKRNIHDISNAPFRTKFEDDLSKHQGNLGIGIISDYEDQPLLIGSHHGVYAIATVGRLNNLEALVRNALARRGTHLSELKNNEYNPTEVVATLINEQATLVDGIRWAQRAIQGSCSLLLLTADAIYVARDRLERTPVVVGRRDGAFAVAVESSALPNFGYETIRDLGPGEIARVTAEGIEVVTPPGEHMQICSFLWIYHGYPASTYEGVNTEAARNRCGQALARRDEVAVDCVAGIPDSGIGHAIGYAAESGVPYRRPFVKYTPTWFRSFMPQEQRVRDLVARRAIKEIEGDAGQHLDQYADHASERYVAMVDRIRTRLGLTTLRYQTLPDMIAAIGLPREKVCTFCWNGEALHEDV